MQLEIITPEQKVFKGEVTSVTLPGSAGQFGVLDNHAPIISTLEKGTVKFSTNQSVEKNKALVVENGVAHFNVKGGVVEVLKNKIIVLAQ